MTDNELIDVVLNFLYNNISRSPIELGYIFRQGDIKIDKEQRERIIIKLSTNGLALIDEAKFVGAEYDVQITGKGLEIIETHGSYSSFLESRKADLYPNINPTVVPTHEAKVHPIRNWSSGIIHWIMKHVIEIIVATIATVLGGYLLHYFM